MIPNYFKNIPAILIADNIKDRKLSLKTSFWVLNNHYCSSGYTDLTLLRNKLIPIKDNYSIIKIFLKTKIKVFIDPKTT